MNNRVLYASIILTLSAVLMSTVIFSADARVIVFEEAIKGNGVQVGQGTFQLTINPNPNSKEFTLQYGFFNNDNKLERAKCINVTDKIVKISALKKASIEFNTGDKNLGVCVNLNPSVPLSLVDISVEIQAVEPIQIEESFDEVHQCNDGICSVTVGTTQTVVGDAIVRIDGNEVWTGHGKLFKVNQKQTYWEDK